MPSGVAIIEAPSGNLLLTNRRLKELTDSIGEPTAAPGQENSGSSLLGVMQADSLQVTNENSVIQGPKEISFLRDGVKTTVRMATAPVLDQQGKMCLQQRRREGC